MKYLQEVFFLNLNCVVNDGGFVSLKPEDKWQLHKHRFKQNKFYCITGGSCTIYIEGTEYTAQPGDWFFIPANAQHFYVKSHTEHLEKFWMHFDIYPTDTNLFALLDLPYVIHIEENETFAFLKEMVETDYFEKLVSDYLLNNSHAVLVELT